MRYMIQLNVLKTFSTINWLEKVVFCFNHRRICKCIVQCNSMLDIRHLKSDSN